MKRFIIVLLVLFLAINVNAQQGNEEYRNHYNRGTMFYAMKLYIDAEFEFKKALEIAERDFGAESEEMLLPLAGLADIYRRCHMYGEEFTIWLRLMPLVRKYRKDDPEFIAFCDRYMTQALCNKHGYKP